MKVLILDDDSARSQHSHTLFERKGFSIQSGSSVRTALGLAVGAVPDAIVAAVPFDGLSAPAICSVLKSVAAFASAPIVLVVDVAPERDEIELLEEIGIAGIVTRTTSFDELCTFVQGAIQPPNHSADPPTLRPMRRALAESGRLLVDSLTTERRCRTVIDAANDAIAVLTPDGYVMDVNRRWQQIRGLTREELIGGHIREYAPIGQEDVNVAVYMRLVEAKGGQSMPVPIRHANGSVIYLQFSNTVVDLSGQSVVIAIGRDVTETIEATRLLEASESKYRSLIENIPDIVWRATLEGRITFISPQVESICGFSAEELMAAPQTFWVDRVHPDDRDRVHAAYRRLELGTPYTSEYRWRHKDGKWIWIRSHAVLGRSAPEPFVEGTFAEVTEHKRMEEEIRQSQKMEALGQLTGGVAHDFNNMLAIILGNGRMLLEDVAQEDPRRADVEAVVEAGDRAAALTRQLLTFSRRQIVQPQVLNLDHLVGGIEKMLRRVIGEDVELIIDLHSSDGALLADAGEIEQVIFNLALNARDAMPAGGRLRIETSTTEVDAFGAVNHIDMAAGTYVVLTVTDTGCGMDADTRERIFEPFFTTKGQRGTGLGLSTCYGIIKRDKGHIWVYSEPDQGSVFKVYFPSAKAGAPETDRRKESTDDYRGTETVLVIEDDNQLRATITKILNGRGYSVVAATHGQQAMALADAHPEINVVLSDMVMPGMNGPDAVSSIQTKHPQIKAVFMSGYTDHPVLRNGVAQGSVNFIQKPFSPIGLAAKIRESLRA